MRDRLTKLLREPRIGEHKNIPLSRFLNDASIEAIADHLLANGVIVPPCKVGDTVYKLIVTSKGELVIWEIIVTSVSVDIGKNGVRTDSYVIGHLKNTHCGESVYFLDFGKTVFLTREEAEKALAEMEGKG